MATQVVVRTPNHLGDCIMALPMINDLHEAYPDAEVTIMAPQYLEELFKHNPSVENLILIPSEHVHGLIAVKKGVDLLHGKHYDVGYVMPPSFGSAATFKLAGVSERIGYITDGRRLLLSKPLPLSSPIDSEHRSVLFFNLLRRATGAELEHTRPKLFISDEETRRAVEILDGFGIDPKQPYVVIAPQAVAESRRWGSTNYGKLAARLIIENGLAIALVGSTEEAQAAEEVITQATESGAKGKWLVNLCGKTTLRESGAIMSSSRLFIGNDSGAAHLAAAVGAPLVVLSGADNPKETSPQSNRKEVVIRSELECISCVKNKCPLKDAEFMQCMTKITVDEVYAAAGKLL